METNAYSILGRWVLASPARLLHVACCPDKDLVALISRLGGHDRLSLWKIQGAKTWEVDVSLDNAEGTQIVDIAWSPDGQSIAVAHYPSCITLHSIQDGRRDLTLTVSHGNYADEGSTPQLNGLWWFRDQRTRPVGSIPDIFKRNDVITGSACSVLKALPLLDNPQDDSQLITATDLFAFQGSQTTMAIKTSLPPPIDKWPALSADPMDASITNPKSQKAEPSIFAGEVDQSNVNSLLIASDTNGHLHCFLDGSFPLGAFSISGTSVACLRKHPLKSQLYAQLHITDPSRRCTTELLPAIIDIPRLDQRCVRDLASLSTIARELLWYCVRVSKDMRSAWFGTECVAGAREIGPRWIRALEAKQREQFGQEDPNPVLDLTCLLLTGKASESLSDFLGSGEQTSERGLQKWEAAVTEALVKLRDFSEKRISPACQRLMLILEELCGWSKLPNYAVFDLDFDDLKTSVDLCQRTIVISNWLAAASRRELFRFREFLAWLRSETVNANSNENIQSHHDILEVNNYFISGLVESQIDKWFMGPLPRIAPSQTAMAKSSLVEAIQQACDVARSAKKMQWQSNVIQADYDHLDRNLDALVQELAKGCFRIFNQAAGAISRSVSVSFHPRAHQSPADNTPSVHIEHTALRKHVAIADKEWIQSVAIRTQLKRSLLCIVKVQVTGGEFAELPRVNVALLDCFATEDSDSNIEILEAEFFDDESIVVVYRLPSRDAFITTISYTDWGYQQWKIGEYVKLPVCEDLMSDALGRWKQGELIPVRVPITRCRALSGCKQGSVRLAVNGRIGRRVACVLDSTGTSIETFDLEGDGDDMEVEQEEPEEDAEEDVAQ